MHTHTTVRRCVELTAPDNGTVTVNDPDLLVGTVATYSCDPGYILVGDTVRTCEGRGDGTEGTWNSTQPMCAGDNVLIYVACIYIYTHAWMHAG